MVVEIPMLRIHCIEPWQGGYNPPFLDPGALPPAEPIEPDAPKAWKVLRSRNGNLPVYTRPPGGIWLWLLYVTRLLLIVIDY